MVRYHDVEWGVPVHDDRLLFEFLILEGAQAGLNWRTILDRRLQYRQAFSNFDAGKIARLRPKGHTAAALGRRHHPQPPQGRCRHPERAEIPGRSSRIRHVRQVHLAVRRWQPDRQPRRSMQHIPATTAQSDSMSKDLKKRGFKFVGSTICYAFMQAVGMVNDHELSCYRHDQIVSRP